MSSFFQYFTVTGVKKKKKHKKTSSLDRGLHYRGSTIRYIIIYLDSIFVGIRIFQNLNLLLVRFDPISLMRSKAQNAYLYKTALSPSLLRFQIKAARLCSICNDAE